jgi:hypothetical protein
MGFACTARRGRLGFVVGLTVFVAVAGAIAVLASLWLSRQDKVDIMDWATTSPSFRKIIEQQKVIVQGSTKP